MIPSRVPWILNAGWWPVSWRDAPGDVYDPHKHAADQTLYLVEGGMEFEEGGRILLSEQALAPDA